MKPNIAALDPIEEKDMEFAIMRFAYGVNPNATLVEKLYKAYRAHVGVVKQQAEEIDAMQNVIKGQDEEIDRLQKALEYYARQSLINSSLYCDGGQRAREALRRDTQQ